MTGLEPLAAFDWDVYRRCKELVTGPCPADVLERLVAQVRELRRRFGLAALGTLLAEALNRLGDPAGAEEVLQEDVATGVADQWTHYWLAHQLDLRGGFEQAAVHIRRSHAMRGWPQSEANAYAFSHDYFSGFIATWQRWFQLWIRQAPLEAVLVGVGQGGTALWLLDQVIAPRSGSLRCLDGWAGSSGYPLLDADLAARGTSLRELFAANLSRGGHSAAPGRVQLLEGAVEEQLAGLPAASTDLVWIHGASGAEGVLEQAVLALRLLRPGGFLVFDDVQAQLLDRRRNPGRAVAMVLDVFRDRYRLLARGQQVLLQRRRMGAQPLPQRLLLLLGMHRSGTSALAGLLQSHGFQGPREVPPADANNPSGYWEPQRIVACHTALLEQLGSSWDDPLLADGALQGEQGLLGEQLPAALDQLEQALEQAFPVHPGQAPGVALVKDPRQCRLLLLWAALIAANQIEAAAVLVVRDPLAVVASLQARDQLPVNRALLLWLQHTLEAERHSRQLPRRVVSYRRLLAAPEAVLEQVRQLWPEEALEPQGLEVAAGGFRIDPQLDHSAAVAAGLADQAEPALLQLAERVYGLLQASALDLEALDQARALVMQRLQLAEEQLGRNVTLQVFWQLAGQPEFCEGQSERLSLAIGRGRAQARLPLPAMAAAPVALRLDPAEQPGIVTLQRLALLDADGERLWQWQAADVTPGDGRPLPLQPATAGTRLMERSIVCLDHDPAVTMQVPAAALEQLAAGGTLVVEAQWEPLSAELGGMLQAIS